MAVVSPAVVTDTLDVSETTAPDFRPDLALLLLQAGVPLSLLVDLTSHKGPDSSLISFQERLSDPLPLVETVAQRCDPLVHSD